MWVYGVVGQAPGPSCFRSERTINDRKWCDDRGEGQGLREEQPGGHYPGFMLKDKFVERCITTSAEAKGVPILLAKEEKLF